MPPYQLATPCKESVQSPAPSSAYGSYLQTFQTKKPSNKQEHAAPPLAAELLPFVHDSCRCPPLLLPPLLLGAWQLGVALRPGLGRRRRLRQRGRQVRLDCCQRVCQELGMVQDLVQPRSLLLSAAATPGQHKKGQHGPAGLGGGSSAGCCPALWAQLALCSSLRQGTQPRDGREASNQEAHAPQRC
jgi:hypothetical protein